MAPQKKTEFWHVSGIYDVDAARRLIERHPRRYGPAEMPLSEALIRELAEYVLTSPRRVAGMSIEERDRPGILCMPAEDLVLPIDGHNRIQRRWRDGLREMSFYLLPPKATQRIVRNQPPNWRRETKRTQLSDGSYAALHEPSVKEWWKE